MQSLKQFFIWVESDKFFFIKNIIKSFHSHHPIFESPFILLCIQKENENLPIYPSIYVPIHVYDFHICRKISLESQITLFSSKKMKIYMMSYMLLLFEWNEWYTAHIFGLQNIKKGIQIFLRDEKYFFCIINDMHRYIWKFSM